MYHRAAVNSKAQLLQGMTKYSQSIVGYKSLSIFTDLTPQSHVIDPSTVDAVLTNKPKSQPISYRDAQAYGLRTGMNNPIRVGTPTCVIVSSDIV